MLWEIFLLDTGEVHIWITEVVLVILESEVPAQGTVHMVFWCRNFLVDETSESEFIYGSTDWKVGLGKIVSSVKISLNIAYFYADLNTGRRSNEKTL